MFNTKWAVFATAVLGLSFQLMASAPPGDNDNYFGAYFYGIGPSVDPPDIIIVHDASVTILDPGVNAPADICANIYVLNPSEEMEACCSVELTPDEIVQSQVSSLLINLLNNNGLVNGVIKIISSTTKAGLVPCPSGATAITPVSDLRAWITRVDSTTPLGGGRTGVTTTAFAEAPLSAAEETGLVNNCHFIYEYGSNFGQCFVPVEPLSGGRCPPGEPDGNDCIPLM
jgi:hypothetical protein